MDLIWPWQAWREYRNAMRDLEVKHAKERAAFTAWEIECWHYLLETKELNHVPSRRP
jgi:hypothetical protein